MRLLAEPPGRIQGETVSARLGQRLQDGIVRAADEFTRWGEEGQHVCVPSMEIARLGVGTFGEQKLDGSGAAVLRSEHQGGAAVAVASLEIGAAVQKFLDAPGLTRARGVQEF